MVAGKRNDRVDEIATLFFGKPKTKPKESADISEFMSLSP
jgi:hypothetical protein